METPPTFFHPAFAAWSRQSLQVDPHLLRRARTNLLKHFLSTESAFFDSPLRGMASVHSLELFHRCDSGLDGASKLLFRTNRGLLIESVLLRIATGRTTLCVSSQVGCAAACSFCATGKMGLSRNLSADEILDQVLQAGQLLAAEGRKIRNIVFMGMGEPLHNEVAVHDAIGILVDPAMFHHSPKKILVSTVGVADGMIRLAERFPTVNQALSLHSVRQDVRERLIPLAKKYPLDQLRKTITELNRRFGQRVMVEYLMLAGVNDSEVDAAELIGWLSGLDVHVNLIPYNPIDDAPGLAGSDLPTVQAFGKVVRSANLKTTIRRSLGGDIAAACGQLVRQENRQPTRRALSTVTITAPGS